MDVALLDAARPVRLRAAGTAGRGGRAGSPIWALAAHRGPVRLGRMSRHLPLTLAVGLGVLLGLGAATFRYAEGFSYFSNDPQACANCHVMQEQFDGWVHSSHRSVAVCNDCHTPPGLLPKYWTKAQNGFWHSFYFTTGDYPDPIRITERNRAVTEKS